MGLTVKKGYLIHEQDYDLFDEILTLIGNDGQRYVLFAPGVRKITSKNSRSLFYGNYLEFEFFQSRFASKVSKLKKVTTLSNVGFDINHHPSLDLISEILTKIKDFHEELYEFYQRVLNLILLKVDSVVIDILIYLYFLSAHKILTYHGYQTCYHQHEPQIGFDLTTTSFVCQQCLTTTTVLLDSDSLDDFKQLLSYHDETDLFNFHGDLSILKQILKKLFYKHRKEIYENSNHE